MQENQRQGNIERSIAGPYTHCYDKKIIRLCTFKTLVKFTLATTPSFFLPSRSLIRIFPSPWPGTPGLSSHSSRLGCHLAAETIAARWQTLSVSTLETSTLNYSWVLNTAAPTDLCGFEHTLDLPAAEAKKARSIAAPASRAPPSSIPKESPRICFDELMYGFCIFCKRCSTPMTSKKCWPLSAIYPQVSRRKCVCWKTLYTMCKIIETMAVCLEPFEHCGNKNHVYLDY